MWTPLLVTTSILVTQGWVTESVTKIEVRLYHEIQMSNMQICSCPSEKNPNNKHNMTECKHSKKNLCTYFFPVKQQTWCSINIWAEVLSTSWFLTARLVQCLTLVYNVWDRQRSQNTLEYRIIVLSKKD